MGKLLQFDGRKKSAIAATPVSGAAQIILFTGVRYERGTPPPPSTSDLASKRGKRKRG